MTVVEFGFVVPPLIDKKVDTVERHAPVVTDNAAPTISVWQTGNEVRVTTLHDLRCISVEHAIVVRLSIFSEDLGDFRIGLDAVSFQTRLNNAPAAEGHDRALQRRIGLQAHDDLVIAVDVAGFVRENSGWRLRNGEHAFLALLFEERRKLLPQI